MTLKDKPTKLEDVLKNLQARSTNRIDHFKDDTVDSLNRSDVLQTIKEDLLGLIGEGIKCRTGGMLSCSNLIGGCDHKALNKQKAELREAIRAYCGGNDD